MIKDKVFYDKEHRRVFMVKSISSCSFGCGWRVMVKKLKPQEDIETVELYLFGWHSYHGAGCELRATKAEALIDLDNAAKKHDWEVKNGPGGT